MGSGVARDGEKVDVRRVDTSDVETGADRLLREARPVFDAPKTLLFNGGYEVAVAHERGRDVAVVGVDAQDVH
jgi:hypothetical protein